MMKQTKKKSKLPPPKEILFHLTLSGVELTFPLAETVTVARLKEQLYFLSGIPVQSQIITGLPDIADDVCCEFLVNFSLFTV